MNNINDPTHHEIPNPADEYDPECACCGDALDCEVFTNCFLEDVCGDCFSRDIGNSLLYEKYEVAYVGNGTFKVVKK